MTRRTRFGLLALVVVVAVIGFVILQPGGDDNSKNAGTQQSGATASSGTTGGATSETPVARPTRIRVEGGKPVGGIADIDVNKGDRVRFSVTSDVADEVHVHGYDFMKDVPAGGTVRFDFPAKIDGSFEIELENRQEQIASLKVEP
jgi:hypothetical protein